MHEGSRKEKAREHMIEAARDALVSRGDDALSEVLTIWPDADRQMLRQLSRSAIDEQKRDCHPRPRGSYSAIYDHFLKQELRTDR